MADDKRTPAAFPGIRAALATGVRLMLVSHLGRPAECKPRSEDSLAPVAARLSEPLGNGAAAAELARRRRRAGVDREVQRRRGDRQNFEGRRPFLEFLECGTPPAVEAFVERAETVIA